MAVEGWPRRGRVDVDGMHGMNDTCGSRSREECGLVWQAVGGFGGLLSLFGGGGVFKWAEKCWNQATIPELM